MGTEATHQIGDVAERVGLSLRTIRHYEEVRLVPPSGRSAGGFRLYTEEDIERLRLVKHLRPLEFPLEELRALFDALDRLGTARSEKTRALLEVQIGAFTADAQERSGRLREQLALVESTMRNIDRQARARTRAVSR